MEFLDKLKVQAMDVASTVAERTQETAKTGQLQMQLRTLKGEEKEALTDFGRSAYTLYNQNGLAERSGELAGAAAKIADLRRQVDEKVAEIAELKGESDEDAEADDGPVETVAEELPADDSTE
jgi:hypothetical protein